MKRIIVLCVVFTLCCAAYGQDDVYYQPEKTQKTLEHHFKIVDGKVIWQKVFDYNDTINVRDLFIEKNILTDVAETNQKMIGKLKPLKFDYKSAGFKLMSTPIYILSSDLTGNVSVETKEGKYRITIDNFILTSNMDGGFIKKGEESNYEFYALNKNKEFRNTTLKFDFFILEPQLNKLFTVNLDNSEW
jgi:hypothetical protein